MCSNQSASPLCLWPRHPPGTLRVASPPTALCTTQPLRGHPALVWALQCQRNTPVLAVCQQCDLWRDCRSLSDCFKLLLFTKYIQVSFSLGRLSSPPSPTPFPPSFLSPPPTPLRAPQTALLRAQRNLLQRAPDHSAPRLLQMSQPNTRDIIMR